MDHAVGVLVSTFLAATVRMATPITFAALGETVSERSGVSNIGLEAIMLSGSYFSFSAMFATGSVPLGLLCGIAGGLAVSLLHAVLSIRFKADQTISGLALNFLFLGLTSFLFLLQFGKTTTLPSIPVLKPIAIPLLSSLPLVGDALFNQDPFVYAVYIITAVMMVIFYQSEWGVVLEAVGEQPRAADSAGIRVQRVRYFACIVNGVLGGLGGAYLTMVKLGFFMENLTSGKGYIALVAVLLGRRNPLGVVAASLVIGSAEALQIRLQTMGSNIPSQAFGMLPYVVTILVLCFSFGKTHNPSALGLPYERDKR